MRIYSNCRELLSEVLRDVYEMGKIVKPQTMQNKVVAGNDDYITKEIIMYQYCLTSLDNIDVMFINDLRSKEWVEKEFEERVSEKRVNPGEAYKIREDLWKPFLNKDNNFDYTYNERFGYDIFGYDIFEVITNNTNNLWRVINELSNNPDTRQAVLPIYSLHDVKWIGGGKRVPCSMYYDILIREGKVNISYHQRSADVMAHFSNDVVLAWKMMQYITNVLNCMVGEVIYDEGYLYHTIDSLHSYKKDWDDLRTLIGKI